MSQSQKILIFGNGQIGNFYQQYFTSEECLLEVAAVKVSKADITIKDEIASAVKDFQPDIIINTAAKTNLEFCADNKLKAFEVNALGADNVAQISDENDIYFVHLSSGCIFESKSVEDEKTEESEPNPKSYYSLTKTWAEQLIQFEKSANFKYLILRPRQTISQKLSPMNMLVKMLTFAKFVDTPNTGTVIEDLMHWTAYLLKHGHTGIFNTANPGVSSPWEIAQLIKKHILPNLAPEKISKAELDRITPNTRVDTVLDVSKLVATGADVKPFSERLEQTIEKLGENISATDSSKLQEILEKTAAVTEQRSVTNSSYQSLYSHS